METITVEVPTDLLFCRRSCMALRLVEFLRTGRVLCDEDVNVPGTSTGIYRPNLDGAIVNCGEPDCDAMGAVAIGPDGKISGIDPLMGMAAFEGCRVEGEGPNLIAMLQELEAPSPDVGA